MAYRELLDFVHTARARGISDTDISERLSGAGWYAVDVQDALELHSKLSAPTAKLASAGPQHTPARASDSPVVILGALSFVFGFVGYILLVR